MAKFTVFRWKNDDVSRTQGLCLCHVIHIIFGSPGKSDKYEYLTDEEILPSNQKQIVEQAKFTYSPLWKPFEKQTKSIDDQGKNSLML